MRAVAVALLCVMLGGCLARVTVSFERTIPNIEDWRAVPQE